MYVWTSSDNYGREDVRKNNNDTGQGEYSENIVRMKYAADMDCLNNCTAYGKVTVPENNEENYIFDKNDSYKSIVDNNSEFDYCETHKYEGKIDKSCYPCCFNPVVALDEENDMVVVKTGTTYNQYFKVYKGIKNFYSGSDEDRKKSIISMFKIHVNIPTGEKTISESTESGIRNNMKLEEGKCLNIKDKIKVNEIQEIQDEHLNFQGLDIYNGYIYIYEGLSDGEIAISVYDLEGNCKLNRVSIKEKLVSSGINLVDTVKGKNYEPEGIQIKNGVLYIGVGTRFGNDIKGNKGRANIFYFSIDGNNGLAPLNNK